MRDEKGPTMSIFSFLSCYFLLFIFSRNTALAASTVSVFEKKIAVRDIANLVANLFKWSLSVAGGIALIMLIIGGIMYMNSSGDEQRAAKAKRTVYWALGGLMLLLLAYTIGSIITGIFF